MSDIPVTQHAVDRFLARVNPRIGRARALEKVRRVASKGHIYRVSDGGTLIHLRFGDVVTVTSDTGLVLTVYDARAAKPRETG